MKCPDKKAGLPDMPPFPHIYAPGAEYLLRMMEYNMRVRMWDFIRAAAKVDGDGTITPHEVLAMAIQSQSKKFMADADELLAKVSASDATDRMLRELGF